MTKTAFRFYYASNTGEIPVLWNEFFSEDLMGIYHIQLQTYPFQVIVHEWGHLRYGVFDEYPTAAESNYFYSASNGEIEGTRCTFGLKGKVLIWT